MKQPQFSVVMPAYNAERYIELAVRDVLAQSFNDFELIVVDDGSTDATMEKLSGFSDPRIRVHQMDKNSGLVAALNAGLGLARGRWIARQDADDRCRKDRLECQAACISANESAVLFYSRATLINARGWWRGVLRPPLSDADLRWDLCFRNAVPHTSVVFPTRLVRDELGGYAGDNVTADFDLWSRLLRKGTSQGDREQLVCYRNHSTSIMGQETKQAQSHEGLRTILQANLRDWAGASEEEATCISCAWLSPQSTEWRAYFTLRESLASRDLSPQQQTLSEEDYTLLHRAFSVSRATGAGMLAALRDIAPVRYQALPWFRTAIARLLAT